MDKFTAFLILPSLCLAGFLFSCVQGENDNTEDDDEIDDDSLDDDSADDDDSGDQWDFFGALLFEPSGYPSPECEDKSPREGWFADEDYEKYYSSLVSYDIPKLQEIFGTSLRHACGIGFRLSLAQDETYLDRLADVLDAFQLAHIFPVLIVFGNDDFGNPVVDLNARATVLDMYERVVQKTAQYLGEAPIYVSYWVDKPENTQQGVYDYLAELTVKVHEVCGSCKLFSHVDHFWFEIGYVSGYTLYSISPTDGVWGYRECWKYSDLDWFGVYWYRRLIAQFGVENMWGCTEPNPRDPQNVDLARNGLSSLAEAGVRRWMTWVYRDWDGENLCLVDKNLNLMPKTEEVYHRE